MNWRPLRIYFWLAFGITWGVGGLALLIDMYRPGRALSTLNPLYYVAAFGPSVAGIVMTARTEGPAGIKRLFARAESTQNLLLTVTSREPARLGLERIVQTLEKHCSGVDLKRFDERSDVLEASFLVDFDDLARLSESKAELRALEPGVSVTFVESKGLA